jgi:hypothetical protein
LDNKLEDVKSKWVSPKSTLDAALWESESDNDEADDELSHSTDERIKELACPAWAFPDWDSDEGWIDVLSVPNEASDMVAVPAEETTDLDDAISSEEQAGDCGVLHVTVDRSVLNEVEEANHDSELQLRHQCLGVWVCYETVPPCKLSCNNTSMNAIDFVPAQNTLLSYTLLFLFANFSAPTWQLLCRPPSRHVQLANSLEFFLTGSGNTTPCSADSDGGNSSVRSELACRTACRRRSFHRGKDRVDAERATSQQTYTTRRN